MDKWRADEWTPAVRAAGLEHRPPYALRHTFASFSIAAGVSLFELARFMGTSGEQIDRTYGHLLPDSLERARAALDSFLDEDLPELADILDTASVPESVRSRILYLGFDHRLDEFEDRAQAEVQFWEASRTDAARSSLNSRPPMP